MPCWWFAYCSRLVCVGWLRARLGLIDCGLVLLYLCGLAVIVVARLVAALVLVYGLLRFVVGLKEIC